MTDGLKRHADYAFVFRVAASLLILVSAVVAVADARQPASTGVVRGAVVDAATGAPLSRVRVAGEGEGPEGIAVVTGADGRFELTLPAGIRRVRASVVGYTVAVREVAVTAGGATEVTIPLVGGAGAHTEEVTVNAGRFRSVDPGAPAQQVLGSADIQNLRGVLADDPLRAVQVLPGVATGDDLRSEFSVRGSGFSHMQLTMDGFTTPYLLHAVRAVEDATNSGSIAMINSDILQEVSLVSGGYLQRSGNRTGASLEFNVRAGDRQQRRLRLAASGTNASVVAEGPLGRSGRGSWLISGRQSYLDLVLDRLVDDQVQFGFSDAQLKIQYDLSEADRVELTLLTGRSRLEEPEEEVGPTDLYLGFNASTVAMAKWQRTRPRTVISAGVLGGMNRFRNETVLGVEADRGREHQLSGRIDLRHQATAALSLEGGAEVDALRESRHRQRPMNRTEFFTVNDYAGDAVRVGAYGVARWSVSSTVVVLPGVRVDRWSLTDHAVASPWMQVQWRPRPSTLVRAASGLYQQFPHFEQVVGAWGTTGLDRERAVHVDLGVEQTIGSSARLQIAVYDREERRMLRRPGAETSLVGGLLVRGSLDARFENRLDGSSRGVEVMVQRLDAAGFSGWVSYSYGRNRYRDVVSGESFWGDLDQRHTMNLYGLYRVSPRMSITGKLRVGSNFPAPGYYETREGRYFIAGERNGLRLPSFARLDLRANRTFEWAKRRLTLFAEVVNVLNRENVRYHPPSIDGRTFEARRLFESLLPVVPSAGLLFEF
jgi:hypothetical protein